MPRFEYKVVAEYENGTRWNFVIDANTAQHAINLAEKANPDISVLSVEIMREHN